MSKFETALKEEHTARRIERMQEVIDVSHKSTEANDHFSDLKIDFFDALKKNYQEVNLKGIPELEFLRGGSEDPGLLVDKETLRLIYSEIEDFLNKAETELQSLV